MTNFETNLKKAKSICAGSRKYCSDFSKIYSFPTENVSGYLSYFDLKDKSLLTVGAAQVINSFFEGARDITLYDINPYLPYYVYLLIAAIYHLSYNEFQEFFFVHYIKYGNDNRFSIDIFNKLQPTLKGINYESSIFFDELINSYGSFNLSEYLFDDEESRTIVIKKFNNYLNDENSFNKLKSIIKELDFKYVNGNMFEEKINGTYDNIFLSNLGTTTSLNKFKNLVERIVNKNLKQNGSVLLTYLWNTYYERNDYKSDFKDIYKLPITREILKDFITEHYNIPGAKDILYQTDQRSDLVLIYRKK